jgi:hypothetical protein
MNKKSVKILKELSTKFQEVSNLLQELAESESENPTNDKPIDNKPTKATPSITSVNDPSGIIMGKQGRSYIFNKDKVEELFIGKGINQAKLAEMANVSVITMSKYLKESGLLDKKKTGVRDPESSPTPPAAEKKPTPKWNWTPKEKSLQELRDSIPDIYKKSNQHKCPVCGKLFSPAPQHIYKNPKGVKVCSYTCARKSGGM